MSESVNIQNLPAWISQVLGVPLAVAQIVSGIIILCIITVPIVFLSRARDVMTVLIVGLTGLFFVTALGWIPSSIVILVIIGASAMVALTFKKWIT